MDVPGQYLLADSAWDYYYATRQQQVAGADGILPAVSGASSLSESVAGEGH